MAEPTVSIKEYTSEIAAREAAKAEAAKRKKDGPTSPDGEVASSEKPTTLPDNRMSADGEYLPIPRLGLKMKDLPPDEMPREKLGALGPSALTDSELLAILLRSGTTMMNVKDLAAGLLIEFEGLEPMSQATIPRLMNFSGIGLAKAAQLVAAFEVGRRARAKANSLTRKRDGEKTDIDANMTKPQHIADMMQPLLADLPHEELWVIYLSTRHRYRGKSRVYKGNLDNIGIRSGVIMSGVIERRAPCFTIVHNHPSGDCEPSSADITTTTKLVRAARELDIELVDHVIVSSRGFTSLRDSRLVLFD